MDSPTLTFLSSFVLILSPFVLVPSPFILSVAERSRRMRPCSPDRSEVP